MIDLTFVILHLHIIEMIIFYEVSERNAINTNRLKYIKLS